MVNASKAMRASDNGRAAVSAACCGLALALPARVCAWNRETECETEEGDFIVGVFASLFFTEKNQDLLRCCRLNKHKPA
jgi:hypothetical protein